MKKSLRSIGAVLGGFILVFLLSVATDMMMEALQVFPPQSAPGDYRTWMLVLALFYRTVYTVAGGALTALWAPHHPLRHAVILGAIGFLAALFGAIANWSQAEATGPWYPIALIVLAIPSVWLGGWLVARSASLFKA